MATRSKSLGKVLSYQIQHGVVYLNIDNGLASIQFFSDSVIRVRATFSSQYERDFSYAVCGSPTPASFEVTENEHEIYLLGNKVDVRIYLSKFRVVFLHKNGQIINSDEAAFGISSLGTEITRYVSLQDSERFIGMGEKTGPLDRFGESYEHWNTDKFSYPVNQDPLYLSTPFYIGLHHHLVYGIFLDNTHRSYFNFGASNRRFASYGASDGELNYYFIHDDSVANIIEHYALLTGFMPMPPKWALGLQQCRYSYYPDTEVINVITQYRNRNIPIDVVYLDIHYMDAYKVFTFHPERFPNPKAMHATLNEMNVRTVCIVDPGIKVDPGYSAYESGLAEGIFVTYPDHQPFEAEVWPGWCHFPDFTLPKARTWWAENLTKLAEKGISGYWNDMNEPACWGQRVPDLIEFDYDGDRTTHKKARNVYGLLMAKSSRESLLMSRPNERPFLLNRAGFSGVQRYSAIWTGDNVASDEHLKLGVKLVNSLGLAGVAFAGYDVGGFAGEASPALFCRWIQCGVFSPLFRLHSMINSRDAEPWTFGEEAEEISRSYITLRYRLLPYIYSCFYVASKTALPINRSLAISYPFDANIFKSDAETQYLFGPSLLICPPDSHQRYNKVYVPEGTWYDLFSDELFEGLKFTAVETPLQKIPVFVRAGSIIPMQQTVQHVYASAGDTLELHVYRGANGSCELYEDDGISQDHLNGNYLLQKIEWINELNHLIIHPHSGNYQSPFNNIKVLLHGEHSENTVLINQKHYKLIPCTYRFIDATSNFDPWPDESKQFNAVCNLMSITIPR